MKKIGAFFVVVFCISFAMAPMGIAQSFSSNARRAVVLEAFYALRPAHDGGCNAYINGNCISTWNFINDSTYPGPSAYSALESYYVCNSSNWAVSGNSCPNLMGYSVPSFYSNLASYGLSTAGGSYGNVGRGGQCMFFANLLLYRSEVGTNYFPSGNTYANMVSNSQSNLQTAVEGDVIVLYNDPNPGFTTPHVAIVVQIYRSGSTITALDTIDSNYISDDPGTPGNREVIARHAFCTGAGTCPFSGVQTIQGHYVIWKGTSYYNTTYNPNA